MSRAIPSGQAAPGDTPAVGKVLMTSDAVGGVWTYCLDLAAGLAAYDIEVVLAVMGPSPSPAQRSAAAAIPNLSLLELDAPLDWTARTPEGAAKAAQAVAEAAELLDVDILHLNSPALAVSRAPRPTLGVCHSCLGTWWAAVRTDPPPSDMEWRVRAYWRGLLNCDALAAPSAAFADSIARTYEVPRPRVVHNGRRASQARSGEARVKVLSAGRLWDQGKNLDVCDAAAAISPASFAAAGPLEGPNGERFRPQHLRWLGSLSAEDVLGLLASQPVFVSTALYEPFGLAVLEAAQNACPLVLSDIPTFRELWSDVAVFVDPHDPQALARAVEQVLGAPEAAGRLGEAARERARSYSEQAMTRGVVGLYRDLGSGLTISTRLEAAE